MTTVAPLVALVVLAGVEDAPVDGLVLEGVYTGEVIVLLGAFVLTAEAVVLSELVTVIELAAEDREEAVEVAEDKILPELNR